MKTLTDRLPSGKPLWNLLLRLGHRLRDVFLATAAPHYLLSQLTSVQQPSSVAAWWQRGSNTRNNVTFPPTPPQEGVFQRDRTLIPQRAGVGGCTERTELCAASTPQVKQPTAQPCGARLSLWGVLSLAHIKPYSLTVSSGVCCSLVGLRRG